MLDGTVLAPGREPTSRWTRADVTGPRKAGGALQPGPHRSPPPERAADQTDTARPTRPDEDGQNIRLRATASTVAPASRATTAPTIRIPPGPLMPVVAS